MITVSADDSVISFAREWYSPCVSPGSILPVQISLTGISDKCAFVGLDYLFEFHFVTYYF